MQRARVIPAGAAARFSTVCANNPVFIDDPIPHHKDRNRVLGDDSRHGDTFPPGEMVRSFALREQQFTRRLALSQFAPTVCQCTLLAKSIAR
jgi:hypothetical protein